MSSQIPDHAQAEAAQLITLLRTFVQQDSDRGTVATNIAALADALLDFEQTLVANPTSWYDETDPSAVKVDLLRFD